MRKYLRRLQWKTVLKNEKGNSHPSPGRPENPTQDKPKEKHTKTHINQTNKSKHTEQILKAARQKEKITYKRFL